MTGHPIFIVRAQLDKFKHYHFLMTLNLMQFKTFNKIYLCILRIVTDWQWVAQRGE